MSTFAPSRRFVVVLPMCSAAADLLSSPIAIAHLGPPGTYAEAAALGYVQQFIAPDQKRAQLCPYPSIAQALQAAADGSVDLALIPVENAIQGSVTTTLDTLWQLDTLHVQQAVELAIAHVLLSHGATLDHLKTVYSHPQALGQCQRWLKETLPQVQLIPTASTTEALGDLAQDPASGAIASARAGQLHNVPTLATNISDHPGNCTRFWIVRRDAPKTVGDFTSIAFTVPNVPGALLKPLQILSDRGLNLCRLESRPTRRSFGEYLFFVDWEGGLDSTASQDALEELRCHTEVCKVFGSYTVTPVDLPQHLPQ
ncbi:MAG: prephenate dehydratase [Cyanophyceae cyanobacterium]